MAESSPDTLEWEKLNAAKETLDTLRGGGGPSGTSTLRQMVDPTKWSRTDWILSMAPLVVEAAAVMAPEVTLPIIGAVDLGKAFKLATSTTAGRAAVNAAAGAMASKLSGGGYRVGAAEGAVAGLLSEGVSGVAKLAGRTASGGTRVATLGKSSKMLRDTISQKLPHLSAGLEGRPASKLKQVFGRERLKGTASPAERIYGHNLDVVENNIENAMTSSRPAGLATRRVAMMKGKPLSGAQVANYHTHQELFPVHVHTPNGWAVARLPFKEAVQAMREKWPRGYTLTGTERDTIAGEQWREFRAKDSKAIAAHLKTIDPKLANDWQGARHDWELAHSFGDMFSDPKITDDVTGEINSQVMTQHLVGGTPARIGQKEHLARVAGRDFANKIHGAVTHQKPSANMAYHSDIVKMPDEVKARFGLGGHFPYIHMSFHPPSGEFFPQGTEVPFSEKGRAKIPYSVLRALGRHGMVQGAEATGFLDEK